MRQTLAIITLVVLGAGCGRRSDTRPVPDVSAPRDAQEQVALDVRLFWFDDALPLPDEPDFGRFDPRFYRVSEVSLDGPWLFAFDPQGDGEARGLHVPPFDEENYPEEIEVPYPWQSVLSGVGPEPPDVWAKFGSERELDSYRGQVWYARTVPVPEPLGSGERLILRLGAADWMSEVWVNGVAAGGQAGGFVPHEVDLTDRMEPGGKEIAIAVRVTDWCDDEPSALLGKQGTTWYSCAGGLWQEVTLIRRPAIYVDSVQETMDRAGDGLVKVMVDVRSAVAETGQDDRTMGLVVRVRYRCLEEMCGTTCDGSAIAAVEAGHAEVALDLSGVPVWSPDKPCLVVRSVELAGEAVWDRVDGYMARRNLSIDWYPGHSPKEQTDPQHQFKAVFSDGKPLFLRSVLDQGYHPEGLYSYPSREDRRGDLEAMKQLGFNGIRQHLKPEAPWFYAMADAVGMWVVYDLPAPATDAASGPDAPWRPVYESTMRRLVRRDSSHPCILWWVLFNEGWGVATPAYWTTKEGQGYVRGLVEEVRQLDPGRPVEDHSPGGISDFLSMGQYPHVESDVLSFHNYSGDVSTITKRVWQVMESFYPGATAHFFGGQVQGGEPLFNSEFGGLAADDTRGDGTYLLHVWLNELNQHAKLQGYVFTEAYDVEWERNGLLTYRRTPKEFGLGELGLQLSDLTGDPYLVLGPQCILEVKPGEEFHVTWGIRSSLAQSGLEGHVELVALGDVSVSVVADMPLPAWSVTGGYSEMGSVAFSAPEQPGVYALRASSPSGGGTLRNGLYLVVDDGVSGSGVTEADVEKGNGVSCVPDGACYCEGQCELGLRIPTPGPGRYRISLEGELASFDAAMPQTDDRLRMTSLELRVNDEGVRGALVADCPADHRGVLSLSRHLKELRGLYGFWGSYDLGVVDVGETVKISLRSFDNGVTLFLRGGGRYLRAPHVVFTEE